MDRIKHIILRDELTSCALYVCIAMIVVVPDPPLWVRVLLAGCAALKAFRSDPGPSK